MVEIEAGPYISGGFGDPPIVPSTEIDSEQIAAEKTVQLAAYSIDRTEVSNAAYAMFTKPTYATALTAPSFPAMEAFRNVGPDYPVALVTWGQARAFCRFMGKRLPADQEWEKAARGGLRVGERPNPRPRRIVPWGDASVVRGNVKDTGGERPWPTSTDRGDVSPYGVIGLAGNVQEWTRTLVMPDYYAARGCGWSWCTSAMLPTMLAIPNARAVTFKSLDLGFRCVIDDATK